LELRRPENVVLQQMEQDDMADENHSDRRVTPEREQPKDVRPSTRPSPQSGTPVFNDGLEQPRSGHC
jgi:hypothetical protein